MKIWDPVLRDRLRGGRALDLLPRVPVLQREIGKVDTIHDEGWVKLHRKIVDNPVFKDSEAMHLFIYLLLKANHKQNKFLFNQREVAIDRGQMVTGIERMSKDTGLTHRQIRTRLALLENIGILTRKTTNRFSIITICNYDHYQSRDNEERQAERQANDKQTTTNKNDKNEKKLNNSMSDKKTSDPRVKEFLKYWGEIFLQEIGQSYVFTYGKEGNLIKDLLKVHSLQTIKDITGTFFRDEQCKRRGLTIGIFKQEVNRLNGLKGMDPLEQAKKELYGSHSP